MQITSIYCEFQFNACLPWVYGPVVVDDTEDFIACSNSITFIPSRVSGGVHDVLTIYPPVNEGFGPFGANSLVKFTSHPGTFDGTNRIATINGVDIDRMNWSDSKIEIFVPSGLSGTNSPASGIVKVVKDDLTELSSALDLEVWFNAYTHNTMVAGVERASRIFLRNLGGNTGMVFHKGGGFPSTNDIGTCIELAIDEWKCGTGINFSRGGDLPGSGNSAIDNKNVLFSLPDPIFVNDPSITGWTFLTRTSGCYDSDGVLQTNLSDIDIAFNPNPISSTWNYSPNSNPVDTFEMHFLTVLTHEFGHAAGLGHVTEPYKVMFHRIIPGQVGPLNLHQSDIDGVCNILNFTSSISGAGCTGGPMIPITPTGCMPCSTTSTFDLETNSTNDIHVYPNPVHKGQKILIEFDLPIANNVDIVLYDLSGRELIRKTLGYCNNGNYLQPLDIPFHISSGIHTLSIYSKNRSVASNKVIVYD